MVNGDFILAWMRQVALKNENKLENQIHRNTQISLGRQLSYSIYQIYKICLLKTYKGGIHAHVGAGQELQNNCL